MFERLHACGLAGVRVRWAQMVRLLKYLHVGSPERKAKLILDTIKDRGVLTRLIDLRIKRRISVELLRKIQPYLVPLLEDMRPNMDTFQV
jgi:hypothetical protein